MERNVQVNGKQAEILYKDEPICEISLGLQGLLLLLLLFLLPEVSIVPRAHKLTNFEELLLLVCLLVLVA